MHFKVESAPLFTYDDFNILKYETFRFAGKIPNPTSERDWLIRHVYKEIYNVAEKEGAKVVIVILGRDIEPIGLNEQLLPSNVILVDAQDALLGRLPVINLENYNQKYAHVALHQKL